MARRRKPILALAVALALAFAGCAHTTPGRPLALGPVASLPASSSSHIAVLVMENHEYSDVIGSPDAPFVNGLARRYASATHVYAITHPSLPNYLALTSGTTAGISSDCTDCTARVPSLPDQLDAVHRSWRAYMEDMPQKCFKGGSASGYAKKHDPFMYYPAIAGSPARCANVVPLTTLTADLRAGTLPAFAWLSPNLCDDGHDCSLAQSDRFLARTVPALLRELGPHGLLILTWDEGTSDSGCCLGAAGGRVATIVAGPGARTGASSPLQYDHYSILRTIEDAFGLRHLGRAGCRCTRSLDALLSPAPRPLAR